MGRDGRSLTSFVWWVPSSFIPPASLTSRRSVHTVHLLPFRSERRTKRATSEGRKDVKRKEPTGPVSSRHFPSLLTPYPPEAPLRGSDGVTRRRERAETRWPERGAGMERKVMRGHGRGNHW